MLFILLLPKTKIILFLPTLKMIRKILLFPNSLFLYGFIHFIVLMTVLRLFSILAILLIVIIILLLVFYIIMIIWVGLGWFNSFGLNIIRNLDVWRVVNSIVLLLINWTYILDSKRLNFVLYLIWNWIFF